MPTEDYEIDEALTFNENKSTRRHINDIDPTKISGYFDDDGIRKKPQFNTKAFIMYNLHKR